MGALDRVDEEQRLINSFTYMKKADAVRWTTEETNQFYSVRRQSRRVARDACIPPAPLSTRSFSNTRH